MSRRIVCEKCGRATAAVPMHREDVAMGFERRIVTGTARKPAVHEIKTYVGGRLQDTEALKTLMCDDCGTAIPDGSKCFAVTMWRQGGTIGSWESEFMEVDA